MGLIKEIDYGTPAAASARQVTLTIDGQPVTVPEGTSLMRAASSRAYASAMTAVAPSTAASPALRADANARTRYSAIVTVAQARR